MNTNPNSSSIKSFTVRFHDDTEQHKNKSLEFNPLYHFGIVQLEISNIIIYLQKYIIEFIIDMSGSMELENRMIIVLIVLKNLTKMFAENTNTKFIMDIIGFDDMVEKILPPTQVDASNVIMINETIKQKLIPRGNTNFEKVLIHKRSRGGEEEIKNTMFLSDGFITQGSTDISYLSSLVDTSSPHNFVGLGNAHNSILMQSLAKSSNKHSYSFISDVEQAPLAIASFIADCLLWVLKDVTISIANGEIYDYTINKWANQISVYHIIAETTKTFHIRKSLDSVDDVVVTLNGLHKVHTLDELVEIKPIEQIADHIASTDLTRWMHRQRTQELLFLA